MQLNSKPTSKQSTSARSLHAWRSQTACSVFTCHSTDSASIKTGHVKAAAHRDTAHPTQIPMSSPSDVTQQQTQILAYRRSVVIATELRSNKQTPTSARSLSAWQSQTACSVILHLRTQTPAYSCLGVIRQVLPPHSPVSSRQQRTEILHLPHSFRRAVLLTSLNRF